MCIDIPGNPPTLQFDDAQVLDGTYVLDEALYHLKQRCDDAPVFGPYPTLDEALLASKEGVTPGWTRAALAFGDDAGLSPEQIVGIAGEFAAKHRGGRDG